MLNPKIAGRKKANQDYLKKCAAWKIKNDVTTRNYVIKLIKMNYIFEHDKQVATILCTACKDDLKKMYLGCQTNWSKL